MDVGIKALGRCHLLLVLYHQVIVEVFLALIYVIKLLQENLNKFLPLYLHKVFQDKFDKMHRAGY